MAKDKEIQVKIDAVVNKAEASKSLGQLKKSLLEIQELQAQIGDNSSAEFAKLQAAAEATSTKMAGTRDAIGDIQDKVRTLEGTPVERLTGSFGLLKESIMNLDFDKAKIAFEGFNDLASGALENLKGGAKGAFGSVKEGFAMLKDNPLDAVKSGLSGLAGGVKSLGQTFMSVGKALLTNPIFLLAAVIVAVVAAVVGLLDALGLLKPILNAIKAVIGAIVDAFQAFTDMLGLTTHAQEEMAEKTLAAGDKIKKDIAARGKAQEDLYGLIQGLTDDEIKLLEKKSGVSIANEKNIQDIKIGTLEATQKQLDKEIDALNAIVEAGGELTEDQQKQLSERKAAYAENSQAIKQLEADKQRTIIELNRKSNETLNTWKLKNIADDNVRAKTQLEATKDEEIRKINLQISEAKRYNQDYSKLVEARNEVYKYFAGEVKKIDDAVAKAEAEKKKAAYEAYQANIAKQLEDLKTAEEAKVKKTEEGTEARLKAELDAIDKVEKFQKKYASVLELNKNELIIIEQDNIDKRTKLNEKFYGDKQKLANADAIAQKELAVITSQNEIDRFNNSIALLQEQRDIELADTELTEAQKAKITADYAAQIKEIETEKTGYLAIEKQKQLDSAALMAETELSKSEFELERFKGTTEQKTLLVEDNLSKQLSALDAQKAAELNNSELTEAEKASIEENYRQQKLTAEEEATAKIKELKAQELAATIDTAQKGMMAGQALADAVFAIKKRKLEKGSEEELKAAKKQFNVNKALQLGMAAIDGFKAITTSLAQSPIAIGPIPNPAGIASLAFAAITTAANIVKIASSKFEGGSTPTPPTPPDLGGGGEGGAGVATPSFTPTQFFGLGQSTQGGAGGAGGAMKVYVTETDISSTQNKVRVVEDRATIR